MKQLVLFISLVYSSTISAQIEIPLEQYPNDGMVSGFYFKDINGILDSYTGTWRWTDSNKELTIYLYKDEEVTITRSLYGTYYRDLVFGYYIYKENGTVLIDTRPNLLADLNNGQYTNRGGIGLWPTNNAIGSNNATLLFFLDFSRQNCNGVPVSGSPGQWSFSTATTASIGLYAKGLNIPNCPITELQSGFPRSQDITINKISSSAPPLN